MLEANEARKLAGVGDEDRAKELVIEVLEKVKTSAAAGKRVLHLHGKDWVHGPYNDDPTIKLAYKLLKDLGYKVFFFYEELQFVNMYTVVEW